MRDRSRFEDMKKNERGIEARGLLTVRIGGPSC